MPFRRDTRPRNRSPGRARSQRTTNPVPETLQRPFPLNARDSQTSSTVWPLFGKYDGDDGDGDGDGDGVGVRSSSLSLGDREG